MDFINNLFFYSKRVEKSIVNVLKSYMISVCSLTFINIMDGEKYD